MNDWSEDKPYFNLELGHYTSPSDHGLHIMDNISSKAFSILLEIDKNKLNDISIPKATRLSLIEDLVKFYQLHIDSFTELKSYDILKKIF